MSGPIERPEKRPVGKKTSVAWTTDVITSSIRFTGRFPPMSAANAAWKSRNRLEIAITRGSENKAWSQLVVAKNAGNSTGVRWPSRAPSIGTEAIGGDAVGRHPRVVVSMGIDNNGIKKKKTLRPTLALLPARLRNHGRRERGAEGEDATARPLRAILHRGGRLVPERPGCRSGVAGVIRANRWSARSCR